MTRTHTQVLQTRLSWPLLEKLRSEAKHQNVPMSTLVRQAINDALAEPTDRSPSPLASKLFWADPYRLRVTPELHDQVYTAAVEIGVTPSQFIRVAILRALTSSPRSEG